MIRASRSFAAVVVLVSVSAGCATVDESPGAARTVELQSRSGSAAAGTLELREERGGVRITGTVRGLAPGAEHGFHVHERGDCSAADASSAGPHFDPEGAPHGRRGAGGHHAGDMPNLAADATGSARVDVTLEGTTLRVDGPTSIAGRAVVVHRDADDYSSQPAGNAGPRIACGVIP